jgi:hypothetical protein
MDTWVSLRIARRYTILPINQRNTWICTYSIKISRTVERQSANTKYLCNSGTYAVGVIIAYVERGTAQLT